MEVPLRAALIAWIAAAPNFSQQLNAVVEEAPTHTSLPWLAISASASTDWSTKTQVGREVRIAFELHCHSDVPGAAADLVTNIEDRIASLPREQSGFAIASTRFLRARSEQRAQNRRAILIEYAFRVLAFSGEPA